MNLLPLVILIIIFNICIALFTIKDQKRFTKNIYWQIYYIYWQKIYISSLVNIT